MSVLSTGSHTCLCSILLCFFLFSDSSSEESITQFAEHFKLQNTLRYLSGGTSVGDLPVQLPKVTI